MNNIEKLNKINKELKIIINESSFISNKCRNKIIKMLGNDFSINLPIENFKSIDVVITEDGNIIMRDEEYKRDSKLNLDEIEKIFYEFKEKADVILKKKEINYYTMNDKNNLINVFILIVMIILFLALLYYAFISFINGNFFGCIWLLVYGSSWFVPGTKDRIHQAINFIKKCDSCYILVSDFSSISSCFLNKIKDIGNAIKPLPV